MNTQSYSIALSLAALACEIDYQQNIPNKSVHVEALHAMAKEIAGDRVLEIYPKFDEDEQCQCKVTNLDGLCVDCGKVFA